VSVTVFPDVDVDEQTTTDTRILPPYVVIIFNDEYHSFEFVVQILLKVIRCTTEQAIAYAKQAHESGRAIVWSGSKEVAELKKEQLETFRETRQGLGDIGPLGVAIEPAG